MNVVTNIYGHRHLGFLFQPLVEIEEDTFRFKGRRYSWDDVQSMKVYSGWYLLLLRYSRAYVWLKDGTTIRLNGRAMEKQGFTPHISQLTDTSDAFNELVGIFKQHVA